MLVTHSGLDWWWAVVIAAVVFAGSLEFLLVGLVTVMAPLSQVAVTAFLVNFRHVFAERRPAVTMQMFEGEPHRLIPDVQSGALDIALVYENDLNPPHWPDNLTKVAVLTEERRLLMPPADRPRSGAVRLTDLRDRTWVASAVSPSLIRYCAAAGFEPRIALQTNDFYSACEFVRSVLGRRVLRS